MKKEEVKNVKAKSAKPRSIRFYEEQEKFFAKLEASGINVSHLLRGVADTAIKDIESLINHKTR